MKKQEVSGNSMKNAISMIEVLVSILLLSMLFYFGIKAYKHMAFVSAQNNLRYIALDRIESEMNRLVYAYDTKTESSFENDTHLYIDVLDETVEIKKVIPSHISEESYNIYKAHPIEIEEPLVIDNVNKINYVILKDNIVALLGFKTVNFPESFGNKKYNDTLKVTEINLSLTYPYIVKDSVIDGRTYTPLWDHVETIDLKTIASRK